MGVIKVIEVLATSKDSFEDAVKNSIQEAAKTIKNIRSVYVKDMNAKVENNTIVSYGVNVKISFEIEG
jgi:hypothetical protein